MSGPRILLIESQDDARQALSARLAAEGFDVTAVASVEDGLRATATRTFDVVLLDMVLPERGGLRAYQALRAQHATRSLPIILLSPDIAENRWEVLPYETEGATVLTGRPDDPTFLLARLTQLLTVAR